jgi:hypothetical protein
MRDRRTFPDRCCYVSSRGFRRKLLLHLLKSAARDAQACRRKVTAIKWLQSAAFHPQVIVE